MTPGRRCRVVAHGPVARDQVVARWMTLGLPVVLALQVVLAVPLVPTPAFGQADRPATRSDGPAISEFQDPADERSVSGAPGAEDDDPLPERLEERLYLGERPDRLGAASRAFQEEQIAALLASREALVLERRAQAIELLETFIREEPEAAAEMPDALLRLAELRWEVARGEYLQAFGAWQEVPEANRGPAPRPDYAASMQLYDRILDRHRDFPRYDLVLYMKAYALLEAGDQDGALALYRRILEDFPRSRFVPDAHFALAEHAFGEFRWEDALAEFRAVMRYRDSELYDLSLFESAWCLWKMGDSDAAAVRFRQVLDLGRHRGPMSAQQRRRLHDLQDEALDYLIQVFVEDERNTAGDLFAFLEEIGGAQYANRVLKRLAETYQGQARFERAVEAYTLLLEMDPTTPDAPKYQREIAAAWSVVGNVDATIEAYRVLAATYEPSSTWASQQADPERVARENERNAAAIRRQALTYHERGQQEDQRRALEQAEALYGIYLAHFPRAEGAYQVQFYRAEILFHRLERYPEAGDAYLAAARLNPEGELTRDALYNAIGAFERVREQQLADCAGGGASPPETRETRPGNRGRGRRPRGRRPNATPPPAETPEASPDGAPAVEEGPSCDGETENDKKFAAAIELYVELFPNDPDLPEILFRQGRLYYDRGIYDPAVRLFGQLLERFPNSEYAEPAGELILDSFNRAEDYGNIEAWARRLKSAPAFAAEDKQRRLDGLILQAMFKVGEQLAEQGDHAAAAAAFVRAAEEFPRDERARQALYNAGLEHQRAGDLAGAARAYEQLIERYPGSEEGQLGAWAGAQMYESIAQFRDAARFYEAYGEKFPRGPKREDAMYNATLLRMTAGDYAEAVRDGEAFIDAFGRRPTADDVYFFIGRAHEGAEDWNEAAQTYREYVRRTRDLDRKVEAQTRLGIVLRRAGQDRAADRALSESVRLGKRSRGRLSGGLYYAAQARYLEGERVVARYETIAIAGDSDGLRRRLEQKAELLGEAATIFADVVEFRVAEWATAALYQIGRSYELFAEAMRAFEIPEGLTEDEEMAYQDQLAMFIIPMEEQALTAYEGGYQKAIELRIFNRWTALLREALTRLNDIQYPPLRESGAEIVEGAPLPLPAPLEGLQREGQSEASEQAEEGSSRTPRQTRDRASRRARAGGAARRGAR